MVVKEQRNKIIIKIVARVVRMEANKELNNLYQNSRSVFCFLRQMRKEGKDVEGGRCLKKRDGSLGFIEDRAKIWKEHMEKIINEESEWNQMVETDVIETLVEKLTCNEIVEATQKIFFFKSI